MSCILGFSANLYRRHSQNPVYSVKSADLHEAVHMYGESKCNGFMSLDELDELNQLSNVAIACHGFNHVNLECLNASLCTKAKLFNDDIKRASAAFEEFGLEKDLFVYPYEYSFPSSDLIVKKAGFKYIFAKDGKSRTNIEDLQAQHDRLH